MLYSIDRQQKPSPKTTTFAYFRVCDYNNLPCPGMWRCRRVKQPNLGEI